jgi:uncharacterized membrane protein YfcA
MDLLIQIILTFIIGFIASFIASLGGSGGLLSIPFLIFIGLPANVALATNKCGSIGLCIGSIAKFTKEKKIMWEYAIPFSLMAVLAGFIGAKIMLSIDPNLLAKIIGFFILFTIPFMFISKDLGIKKKATTLTKKIIGTITYFALMVYGAVFGGGYNVFLIINYSVFFGATIIEANATDMVPWFFVSAVSLVMFAIAGIVNWTLGITIFFAMIIGGYVGAHVAVKKGDKWVKNAVVILLVLAAIKLIFF